MNLLNIVTKFFQHTFIFLILSSFSHCLYAQVWIEDKPWREKDEINFRNWVQSEKFSRGIFKHESSPYKGLATDCADVIYAARIIFAFENKLSYKSFNPDKESIKFFKTYITNRSRMFDKYPEGIERVKAFINYLGKFSDTRFLALEDSYPIHLKELKPGDFYVTEQVLNGNTIRHTYIIKKVYPTGIFDLYYSSLPYMVRELKFHRGLPLFNFTKAPFGFRRFKAPFMLDVYPVVNSTLPHFSEEQYELLKTSGSENILAEISRIIRTEEEGLQGRLQRLIDTVCRNIDDRKESIEEAQRYLKTIDHRCVNKAEFHNLSTTLKDQRILTQIKVLEKFWINVRSEQKLSEFREDSILALNYLIGESPSDKTNHENLCSKEFSIPTNIIDFKEKYEAGFVSSHPNDGISVRWGEVGQKTQCQSFY